MNNVNKTNGMLAAISHNAKDVIEKLDKTVTRVVELLMLSNKMIVSEDIYGCSLNGHYRDLSVFSEVERLLSGDDCNE